MTECLNVGPSIVRQIANGSRDFFLSPICFLVGQRVRLTAGNGFLTPATDKDDFVLVEVREQMRRGHQWHVMFRLEVSGVGVDKKRSASVGQQAVLF